MKELGNLAIVAASHENCMLQIYQKNVVVHTGTGNERKSVSSDVWDDERIHKIILYLNYGNEMDEQETA